MGGVGVAVGGGAAGGGRGGGLSAVGGGGGLSGEARAKGMIQEFREKDDEDQVRRVHLGTTTSQNCEAVPRRARI